MKRVKIFLSLLLPWCLKRRLLNSIKGFEVSKEAYIGLSFVNPQILVLKPGSNIGHFNVVINLDKLVLNENSSIGRSNWITGFPTKSDSRHFAHDKGLLFR